MAAQLSGIELVKLGYELCGVYSLPMSQPNYAGTPRGFSRRKALTSVERLTAHVASQGSNRSVKKPDGRFVMCLTAPLRREKQS